MAWIDPRAGLVFIAASLLACDGVGNGEIVEIERSAEFSRDPSGLVGETVAVAEPCEWPTAVVLGSGECSGVLIHPSVVMTAAHCIAGPGPAEIHFGEHADTPARTVATTSCAANPSAMGVGIDDYGYCMLAEP